MCGLWKDAAWDKRGKAPGDKRLKYFYGHWGNKRQLKERLQMIVNKPATMAGTKALLIILMAGICLFTFNGRIPPDISLAAENPENGERAAETENSGFYGEEILAVEIKGTDKLVMEEEKGELSNPPVREGDVLVLDLNFDGWDDLCYRDGNASGLNIPYYCMLWNQQTRRYEYSVMLYNVETDSENQWISCQVREGEGRYCTTFYRYDADNRLHMVRYKEEYLFGDKLVNQLDLTYVDDNGIYTLPAIVDEENLYLKMIAMARETLSEINNWTGSEVDTACFQVTNMGSVFLALSAEDMEHSRVFGSRSFGADTEYNISGYEKSISSIGVASGRNVWFSPILWKFLPENMDRMTDEEVITWYFERLPIENAGKVKTITQRQEDMWTIQTREGKWFEVVYSPTLREIYDVVGPYPSYPEH